MSYLIKERLMMDKSNQGDSVTSANSAVSMEDNFSVKKRGRIQEPVSFETRMENVEVATYRHFPADNITEVWLNIFEKLDAEDKLTFSKTCSELHDLVASKRTNFHFNEVVLMLVQTRNLPARELLRCREICKSWTTAFNRVYPAHPSHLRLETENDEVEENKIIKLENHFTSSQQIQSFLEEMHSHPGNPFPGRSIYLDFDLPYEAIFRTRADADRLRLLREYSGKTMELLEVYGYHLHMAEFDLCNYGRWSWVEMETMEIHNRVRRCLQHLPNLKKLVVSGRHNLTYPENDLASYRQNTLPQLPHLEMVELDLAPFDICNGVLESSCVPLNVKRLVLRPLPHHMEYLRIPEAAHFPNLVAFEVKLPSDYLERFVNVLEGVPIPPVSTIKLHHIRDDQDIRRVFRSSEVFAGSLTCLKLRVDFSEDSLGRTFAVATGFAIDLPQLERLELTGYNGPLDPFCNLPSLKFLTIKWSEVRQWDGSMVDFYGFEDRMEKSNIWEKIPSLQEFHLSLLFPRDICKTYHRDVLQLSPAE